MRRALPGELRFERLGLPLDLFDFLRDLGGALLKRALVLLILLAEFSDLALVLGHQKVALPFQLLLLLVKLGSFLLSLR